MWLAITIVQANQQSVVHKFIRKYNTIISSLSNFKMSSEITLEDYCCGITLMPMFFPLKVLPSGKSYEEESIKEWLQNHPVCPLTRTKVTSIQQDKEMKSNILKALENETHLWKFVFIPAKYQEGWTRCSQYMPELCRQGLMDQLIIHHSGLIYFMLEKLEHANHNGMVDHFKESLAILRIREETSSLVVDAVLDVMSWDRGQGFCFDEHSSYQNTKLAAIEILFISNPLSQEDYHEAKSSLEAIVINPSYASPLRCAALSALSRLQNGCLSAKQVSLLLLGLQDIDVRMKAIAWEILLASGRRNSAVVDGLLLILNSKNYGTSEPLHIVDLVSDFMVANQDYLLPRNHQAVLAQQHSRPSRCPRISSARLLGILGCEVEMVSKTLLRIATDLSDPIGPYAMESLAMMRRFSPEVLDLLTSSGHICRFDLNVQYAIVESIGRSKVHSQCMRLRLVEAIAGDDLMLGKVAFDAFQMGGASPSAIIDAMIPIPQKKLQPLSRRALNRDLPHDRVYQDKIQRTILNKNVVLNKNGA